jgi:hypothetical protein
VDPATLHQLLNQHQPGEVYRLLESLLDFLKMPGNIQQWLPPLRNISVRHAGVERLHYHPRASTVAEAILGYCPFSSSSSSSNSSGDGGSTTELDEIADRQIISVFCVSVHAHTEYRCNSCGRGNDSSNSLMVHAINGDCYEFQRDDYGHVVDGDLVMVADKASGFSFHQCYDSRLYTQLLPVAEPPARIAPCRDAKLVIPNCVLGRCITLELEAALQQMPGGSGLVKVKCCRCHVDRYRDGPVWVVSW